MNDGIPAIGKFDQFAGVVSKFASRAPFFGFCVLLIVLWAPTLVFLPVDTSQLIINTLTTIVTFLLVALLQNSQARADASLQAKLNVIAEGLRDLMDHMAHEHCSVEGCDFADDIERLEIAIGLEDEVGTKENGVPMEPMKANAPATARLLGDEEVEQLTAEADEVKEAKKKKKEEESEA